ncbi:ABC transporter ATP-binding protein [Paenibacillus sp. MER 180]|nr:ABC transporter ATP-binding protein [Paenibacillus sp. MER 180]
MNSISILLHDVSFRYEEEERESLSHFHLSVKPGEFVVVTGRSGCGKTTMTRCINGLVPNFYAGELGGDVRASGLDVPKEEIKRIASKVGSVFQDPRSQFFTLEVLSEIAFPGENLGIPAHILRANIERTVSELELAPLVKRRIFDLSSGQKQKVAIASVYASTPEIYVLDEPSANLDGQGTKQLRQALERLKKSGHTIVVSEHTLYYLRELADRVIMIEDGKKLGEWSGTEFFRLPEVWFKAQGLRSVRPEHLLPAARSQQSAKKNEPFIQAENVTFYYRKQDPILNNISLEAYAGEVVGIIGGNGVGKSTLFRTLMGMKRQKSGTVRIDGRIRSPRERLRDSFIVMQEVDYQFFTSSVEEEILLGLEQEESVKEKAGQLLRYFGIEDYRTHHPTTLSGGQKQRLAIAIACLKEAELLFFDEPTSGLDGANMHKVSQMLRQLAAEGRCLFVISHDYEFILNTVDRVLHLEGSKGIREIRVNKETLAEIRSVIQIDSEEGESSTCMQNRKACLK